MILAVLQQHVGLALHQHDVFVSTVGGARLTEPSNDLAIALAIASAAQGRPLGRTVAAIGELSLSGDVRRVREVDVRLAEAARLGFRAAVVPTRGAGPSGETTSPGVSDRDGMRVLGVDHVGAALTALGLETRGAR